MRPVALAGILASTSILTGCAGTIAGVSLSSISSFAGIASTLFTGADLGEHAASIVTGKDCRFSEGLLREDRDVCEERGSLATRGDFHGIFVERVDADGTVVYAAPVYMTAAVGAGENENNPDAIWAEIKAQKAKEESERQLARATQTIDVAALATNSLSEQALAFLPANSPAAGELSDGDTASQTAARARPVVNAAKPAPKQSPAAAPAPDELAIDEEALTAPLKAAAQTGQGGPLIPTSAGVPVASKLVNGEPIVILRLSPTLPAIDTTSAEPTGVAFEPSLPQVTAPAQRAAPSPLAILDQSRQAAAAQVAAVEPTMAAARPRSKPSARELAAAAAERQAAALSAKIAREAREREQAVERADVFKPPAEDIYASTAPDLMAVAPVHTPADIQTAEPASGPVTGELSAAPASEQDPAATMSPAPLFPIAQP